MTCRSELSQAKPQEGSSFASVIMSAKILLALKARKAQMQGVELVILVVWYITMSIVNHIEAIHRSVPYGFPECHC
jgi:hypothetical protein